jgi:hypothetical protein
VRNAAEANEMQEYVCDKAHRFLFPSIQTETIPQQDVIKDDLSAMMKITTSLAIEKHVCPYCSSADISIAPEEDITSVKSVPLEEVDTYLKEGYKVRELYAKTATLIKTEAKQA